MRASELRKLKRDTIVEVGWLDICEDNTGDPRLSHVVLRKTLGRVWGVKRFEGTDVLTLTFTKDSDGPEQAGWICMPVSVSKEVRVVEETKNE